MPRIRLYLWLNHCEACQYHQDSSHPHSGRVGLLCLQSLSLGFALVFVAAAAGGALALPLKKRRTFELENIYIPSTFAMMIALPILMALLVLPHSIELIGTADLGVMLAGAAYGFGWGIGAILFGYGVTLAGMSVGFAIIMGINTAVGSVLPFVATSRAQLFTPGGAIILMGIAGCVIGVGFCGRAGALRGAKEETSKQPRRFGIAVLICVASGVLSACANLGFTFTNKLSIEAVQLGARPVFSTLASWLPVFWGASVSLLLWFGALQIKRGTWRKNVGPDAPHDWAMGFLMGAIWFLATIPYGMGAYYLGQLGTSAGWALNIAFSLLVANAFGFTTGEWIGAPPQSRRVLYSGLGILVVAIALLAAGTALTGA
ncbi:MAG: L-rhamnose/proton symporter RhaT [Acidobacteriaceae bacterium]